jgi:hypothetical protein
VPERCHRGGAGGFHVTEQIDAMESLQSFQIPSCNSSFSNIHDSFISNLADLIGIIGGYIGLALVMQVLLYISKVLISAFLM